MTPNHNVALVYNDDRYLYRFRGGLLRTLKAHGCQVLAVAPGGRAAPDFQREQIRFIDWPLARRSINPLTEILSILRLWRVYRKTRPDLAQHFTPKPNIYGALAARLAGIPVILASVNGLGYVFTSGDLRARLVRPIVKALYHVAFAMTDAVVFQNRDDISTLTGMRLLPTSKVRHIPGGSGVDTTYFSPDSVDSGTLRTLRKSVGLPDEGLVVLLAARMLWDKGVAEFVEAARILATNLTVHFLLVGPIDTGNPASIPSDTLSQWHRTGLVAYLGEREDIREILALSDVLVLPSYREGTPRILLEGAAMGKPIVTTDIPGCRDVVQHQVNGLLVPPRDSAAITEAIRKLLESEGLRTRLGDSGRKRAEEEFEESKVISEFIKLYDALLEDKGMGRL